MTRTEFLELAKAARLRQTASLEAARMVLTGDMRPGEAAKAAGCSPQAVANVLGKIKIAMAVAANTHTSGSGASPNLPLAKAQGPVASTRHQPCG